MDELRSPWLTRAVRGVPVLVSLAPLITASWLSQDVPSGRPILQSPTAGIVREPIAFSQYAVNLGEVPVQPVITAHFDFWNRGDRPVTVSELEPSCACLNPQLVDGKRTYLPGEWGRFHVQVRTVNETPGPKGYTVKMTYDCAGTTYSRFVTFRATLPQKKLSVEPPQLVFYFLGERPEPQTVYVRDYRGEPLQVRSAELGGGWGEAIVGDREWDEQGLVRVPIHVEITGDSAPGKRMEVLRIRTNDPEFQVVSIPVFLFGSSSPVGLAGGAESPKTGEPTVRPAGGSIPGADAAPAEAPGAAGSRSYQEEDP